MMMNKLYAKLLFMMLPLLSGSLAADEFSHEQDSSPQTNQSSSVVPYLITGGGIIAVGLMIHYVNYSRLKP